MAFEPPQVPTAAQMVEPNRIIETIPAMRVDPYPQGGWVIDLGRNFTGWLEVRLPAVAKGTTVKLEYSDQAEPDQPAPGAPTQPHAGAGGGAPGIAPGANAAAGRGAAAGPGTTPSAGAGRAGRGGNPTVFPNTFNQRDEIVGNGQAVTFRSHFNYHGFRYVRVIGTESPPAVSDAKGYLIRTAYERAGEFNSSNDLLNQIYRMVTRTYEALTLGGYVVDCPTRERLGYGGDAGTSFETGMFNPSPTISPPRLGPSPSRTLRTGTTGRRGSTRNASSANSTCTWNTTLRQRATPASPYATARGRTRSSANPTRCARTWPSIPRLRPPTSATRSR